MNAVFVSAIGVWFLVACTSPTSKPLTVLQAPAGVSPAVATQLDRGNALFAAQKWVEAEQVYFSPKLPTSIGGVVKIGDHLYGTGSKSLICVELKSGKFAWNTAGRAMKRLVRSNCSPSTTTTHGRSWFSRNPVSSGERCLIVGFLTPASVSINAP